MRFADLLFARCEQEFSYCRRLRDTTDANADVVARGHGLRCWFFDKPYPDMYLIRGGTHQTKVLEPKICQKTAVRNSIFSEWNNLETFAVSPKCRHHYYAMASAFRRNLDAHLMSCIPSSPMFAYYSRAFGNKAPRFDQLVLETAMTEFTVMFFVCFVLAA